MKHWGACCFVIFVQLAAAIAIALASSCGSAYYVAVDGAPPDTSDCTQVEREFKGKLFWTPFALPFEGRKKTKLWASKPTSWQDFDGQIYLMDGEWSIDWVDYLRMDIEPYPALVIWDGARFIIDNRVDVKPLLKQDEDPRWLYVEPTVTARGTKPEGNPEVAVNVTFAVCGHNHHLIR